MCGQLGGDSLHNPSGVGEIIEPFQDWDVIYMNGHCTLFVQDVCDSHGKIY